jgi:hypothetical protein
MKNIFVQKAYQILVNGVSGKLVNAERWSTRKTGQRGKLVNGKVVNGKKAQKCQVLATYQNFRNS